MLLADKPCAWERPGGIPVQKLYQSTTLLALTLVLTFASSAAAQWPEYSQIGKKNYVEFGIRALVRPGDDLDLPIFNDATSGVPLLSVDDVTTGGSAAGVELSYHFENRHGGDFEFRTIVGSFDSERQITDGNIATPFFPGQILDTVDYQYESRIFSLEVNRKRSIAQGLTLFGGPRFFQLNEEASFSTFQQAGVPGATATTDTTTVQSIDAINNLIGLQVGLRRDRRLTPDFRSAVFIRTGGYFNPTRLVLDNSTSQFGVTGNAITDLSKSTGSFLVELGGKVYWDLSSNCSLFAGYEATWIDGIALAPPQFLNAATTGEVETSNTLFFHSITAGFRVDW